MVTITDLYQKQPLHQIYYDNHDYYDNDWCNS